MSFINKKTKSEIKIFFKRNLIKKKFRNIMKKFFFRNKLN